MNSIKKQFKWINKWHNDIYIMFYVYKYELPMFSCTINKSYKKNQIIPLDHLLDIDVNHPMFQQLYVKFIDNLQLTLDLNIV